MQPFAAPCRDMVPFRIHHAPVNITVNPWKMHRRVGWAEYEGQRALRDGTKGDPD